MFSQSTVDALIVGGGMVGLSTAWQLLEKDSSFKVAVIEKEPDLGMHSSGRNSGILHAGIYYPPCSLKAKVCVIGARRLRAWCEAEKLPVLACGKVITPQKTSLDPQLDLLLERGMANGANVEIIDQLQFNELVPDGRTSSGRALWSPDTCVVKPLQVIQRLKKRLIERGVRFFMSENSWSLGKKNQILLSDQAKISYSHLFNCAGLQADRVAHKFGVGQEYTMLPFRGGYYQLKPNAPLAFRTNLYPVPDLEVPFLGVHISPSVDGTVYIGPTATPALGRENYQGLKGAEPFVAFKFLGSLARQAVVDRKIRRYIRDQAFDWMPHRFLAAAQQIVPALRNEHIEPSLKSGIRPQLYDRKKNELVQDFVMMNGPSSTHIVNAISPAFTASFELADHILENTKFNL
jgi:(S)-2-hydroxyglutarate dehydrogenase